MSALRGLEPIDAPLQTLAQTSLPGETVILKRSGAKPLTLQAALLAQASSWIDRIPAWHEIALYQTSSGDIAAAIKTCLGPQPERALFHAGLFADLDTACQWLLDFEPTEGLSVDFDPADPALGTVALALRAASLRQRADWVSLQYRVLMGELLYRLDLGS